MWRVVTIIVSSFLGPLVYMIFKYAIREKTYEEILAEQKAAEQTLKIKMKQQQHPLKKLPKKEKPTKKVKSVEKEVKANKLVESKEKPQEIIEKMKPVKKNETEIASKPAESAKKEKPKPKVEMKCEIAALEEIPVSSVKNENSFLEESKVKCERQLKKKIVKAKTENLSKSINKKCDVEIIRQKISSEKDRINMNILMPLMGKAELSIAEVQVLIDLLLNKIQECGAPIADVEWSEGKQDPMVKLKRQLAEKEKALASEQEAFQALQAKLKELRKELNGEKSSLKALEEAKTAENLNLTAQLSQLQSKLLEEERRMKGMENHHAQEKKILHNELLNRRKELEVCIQKQSEEHAQRMHQQGELTAQLGAECAALRDELVARENQIVQLQEAQNRSSQEIEARANEYQARVLDLERNLLVYQAQMSAMEEELRRASNCVDELTSNINEIGGENEALKVALQEAQQIAQESSLSGAAIVELNERLKAEMESLKKIEGSAKMVKDDYSKLYEAYRLLDELCAQQRDQLHTKDETIRKLVDELNGEKAKNNSSEQTHSKAASEVQLADLKEKLNKQTKKNEELRNKNYKVMEALGNMEKNYKEAMDALSEAGKSVKLKTRTKILDLLRKNKIEPDESRDEWCELENAFERLKLKGTNCEKAKLVQEEELTIKALESHNVHLTQTVTRYKDIISDTEGMLNNLQSHVEREEANWREQNEVLRGELEKFDPGNPLLNVPFASRVKACSIQSDASEYNGHVEGDSLPEAKGGSSASLKDQPPLSNGVTGNEG